MPFRRKFLIVGGAFALGCVAISDANKLLSGPILPDRHLFFEMDWTDWTNFAWSLDSKGLLCVKQWGELDILDLGTKRMNLLDQRVGGNPNDSQFSPVWSNDRRSIVYAVDSLNIIVQRLDTGRQIEIAGDMQVFLGVSLSPDGSQLACFNGGNGKEAQLSIWETQEGKLIWKRKVWEQAFDFPVSQEIFLTWSPDGKCISLAFRGANLLYTWRTSDGQPLWKQAYPDVGEVSMLSWSADSSSLATSFSYSENFSPNGYSTVSHGVVWNGQTGQKLFEKQFVENGILRYPYSSAGPFVWSPKGADLAFFAPGREGSVMQVWDVQRRQKLFSSQPITSHPGSISWSPDGRMIAAGCYVEPTETSENNADYGSWSTIRFWSARNGQEFASYNAPRRPALLTWSPNSRFLAVQNTQTYGYSRHGFGYGVGEDGVGFQNLASALQIFQAPR